MVLEIQPETEAGMITNMMAGRGRSVILLGRIHCAAPADQLPAEIR